MNVRREKTGRNKGHATVTLPPFGRMPIRDAKASVFATIGKEHEKNGKQKQPGACVRSLCWRDHPSVFPGQLLAVFTRKTYTLAVVSIKNRLKALRYVHSVGARDDINGFDSGNVSALKAGDEIALLAPTKTKKLGVSKGKSNPGNIEIKNPRKKTPCYRRGSFADLIYAQAAKAQDKTLQVTS